jgi:hypothetical protein
LANKQQLLCLWSGPAFVAAFVIGFFLSGFLPPPSPLLPAEAVAAYVRDHADMIRLGQIILTLSSGCFVTFTALITTQMKKIPGCAPEIIYTEFAAGCVDSVFFIVPMMVFMVETYRPERDPQTTLMLNDLGWMTLVAPVTLAMVQTLAIGIGILSDTGARPIFARWVGYFNIAAAVVFLPGVSIAYFKSGPFDWGGIFAFWIPGVIFSGWFLVMFFALRRAIER